MSIDWSPFVDLVRRHQRFLLMTHIRPDGDGLGAQLALADHLERLGKQVRIVIASRLPDRYLFLDPNRTRIENFTPPGDGFRDCDAILVLDTGTWNQLGDFGPFMQRMNVVKCVIDHHRTQDDLGGLRLVDVSAEATGRLIYEACCALGGPLSTTAANALFMALATDTGWFRHPNTTAATFTLAAELTRLGANPTELYEILFERSTAARMKLVGRVLDRLRLVADGRIAFTEVHRSDYVETGALPGDTEDLINYPRGIDGVLAACLLMEQPAGGIKVSFRAKPPIDVAKIAESFGGGGHKLAAGAIVATDSLAEVRERVLTALTNALP